MRRGEDVIAPSSSEEGVGGGERHRAVMLRRAASMRSIPTEPERRMWNELRGSRLHGCKFRRQAIIGSRIVDFFCPAKGLIVEIDGDTHDREKDLRRDTMLARQFGFRTIRFTNSEVMLNMVGVLTALSNALREAPDRWPGRTARHHPPTPSSEEEGE